MINSALFNNVESLTPNDLSKSLTYASYLKVRRRDGSFFDVYVDGDSAEVWLFFKGAEEAWLKQNK
ncbi:hypothetical protein BH09BAC1_BH09BAC1_05830 [soil metagenome]